LSQFSGRGTFAGMGFNFILFSCLLVLGSDVYGFTFSKNLNFNERAHVVRTLGFGGTPKSLTSPLPLGGDLGLEFGISYDFISTSNLRRLGDRQGLGDEVSIPALSIGKGLFSNIDFFFQFSPLPSDQKINHYAGLLRWAFYDIKTLPIKVSLNFSAGVSVFDDFLSLRSTVVDVLTSYYLDNLSLYFGVGYIRSSGYFYGGSDSLADDLQTHLHEDTETRSFVGLDYDINPYFFTFEINRFTDTVFALKLGLRI